MRGGVKLMMGLEPMTSSLPRMCAASCATSALMPDALTKLSYIRGCASHDRIRTCDLPASTPPGNRTQNLGLKRPLLYPIELARRVVRMTGFEPASGSLKGCCSGPV